jgi:hypothetical protein
MEERLFSYLFFKAKEANGRPVVGKFEPLKVRFLYSAVEQIPLGRVHLYNYAPKKFSRVLCLKNGMTNKQAEKHSCPMCDVERFGTPSSKYYAFVSDLNDDGALKLLEFNYSLGKQLDDVAELKGRPLHDLVFVLSKKGTGKETTYTAMLDETSPFNVTGYFKSLGIADYPALVGGVGDKTPVLQLSAEQMQEFINGNYPWSTGESSTTTRKFTALGATVTVRNEQTAVDMGDDATEVAQFEDEESMEIVDDTPSSGSFF